MAKENSSHGVLAVNRKARFDVAVEKTYEAGLRLTGDEIKSIRAKRLAMTGSYVKIMKGKQGQGLPQVVLVGLHLSAAKDPERSRALLLHAREVREIESLLAAKGKAAVPLSLFLKRGWAKVEVGVGSGRKQYDKRELIKRRDLDRQQRGELKRAKPS